jgi:hypothetical protein
MKPDISEFSYGFALTRELIDISEPPLRAAPVFPSLVQEGRAGYDVELDIPGFPLFLQFKRSDCMVSRNAFEASPPWNFVPPFYRMQITERSRSAQHELLLDLDAAPNIVLYAAPLFHTVQELNDAYKKVIVSKRSFYISPGKIGRLDAERHHIAFDDRRYLLCSEPRMIEGIRGEEFRQVLNHRLRSDDRPFGHGPLDESLALVEQILRGRDLFPGLDDADGGVPERIDPRLQRLAGYALRYFNALLFVVRGPTVGDVR